MEELRKIREMLYRSLREYTSRDEIPPSARAEVHMITDTIKNTYKIEMYEQSEDGDAYESGESYGGYSGRHYVRGHYSRDGGSYEGQPSRRGGSYEGQSSRRGGSYEGQSSRRRYSYDEGKEEVRKMLEEAMNTAQDGNTREKIRKCMEQIEQ